MNPRDLSGGLFLALCVFVGGCRPAIKPDPTAASLFGPTAMRIHPIFTGSKDWTGDDKPDGIEALIEFQDRFGDPTKAIGTVMFELFDYRRASPDPRGARLMNPWIGSMRTVDEQQQHWNRTSRTYAFQLAAGRLDWRRRYVLTAMFDLSGGGRFFDTIILEPEIEPESPRPPTPTLAPAAPSSLIPSPSQREPSDPATLPTQQPTTRIPSP